MAAQVIFDTIDNSAFETNRVLKTLTRGGKVVNIPNTTNPADAMVAAMIAIGVPDNAAHPTQSNYKLSVRRFIPLSTDAISFQYIYDTAVSDITTTLTIRTSGVATTTETNKMPGTQEPFTISYQPSAAAIGLGAQSIPEDFLTIAMPMPVSQINVSRVQVGTLSYAEQIAYTENVCTVNNATWQGYPPGSWLITNAESEVSVYAGYYTQQIQAVRRKGQLWNFFGNLRSQVTGKYATDSGMTTRMATLAAQPYTGKVYRKGPNADGLPDKGGFGRVDPYDAINFTALFGF